MSIVLNGNFDADLKLTQHFDCDCSDNDEPKPPCPPVTPICPPITPICPPIRPICPPSPPIEPFCPPSTNKIVELCPFCVDVEH